MSGHSTSELAARWAENMRHTATLASVSESGDGYSGRPMSEAQIEKVLADYRDQYVLGWFDLEQLERHVELALRAYYSSRPG